MIHFTLKRKGWGYDDIYEAMKTGKKTIEWRDASPFWESRLFSNEGRNIIQYLREQKEDKFNLIDKKYWKDDVGKFVVGYTSFPRLIMQITDIMYDPIIEQFAIHIRFIREETD